MFHLFLSLMPFTYSLPDNVLLCVFGMIVTRSRARKLQTNYELNPTTDRDFVYKYILLYIFMEQHYDIIQRKLTQSKIPKRKQIWGKCRLLAFFVCFFPFLFFFFFFVKEQTTFCLYHVEIFRLFVWLSQLQHSIIVS